MTTSRDKKKGTKKKKRISPVVLMKKKLALFYLGVALALCVLIVVIAVKAVSNNDEYSQKALSQLNYGSTTLAAKSGDILDCNGKVLATSYRVYLLIIDPKVLIESDKKNEGTYDATLNAMAECFGLDKAELDEEVQKYANTNYLRYNGKTVLSEEQKTAFEQKQSDMDDTEKNETKARIRGVWFETEYRRNYPFGSEASKAIGFTSTDGSAGLGGLEQYYNDILRGSNGREYGYINDESDLERTVIPATDGYTLVTTLDMNMQKLIEESVEEWKAEYSSKSYAVLAMDPNTGEVKAMVTSTDFDLNNPFDLSAFYTQEEIDAMSKEKTSDALNGIWRNYITNDGFEPGSTAKMFTYAAALEEGTVVPEDLFYCGGHTQVANYLIRCHNDSFGGCKTINAAEAVAESCNVAFMEMGKKLGREQFARYQMLFNLGQRTGIDLPGEEAGILHDEAGLNEVELATCSFGQGFNATMIQVAAGFSSLINGGNYYQPHLVSQILDSEGQVVKTQDPVLVRKTVSNETCEYIKQALGLTTEIGTAESIQFEGYDLGAKTGTSEKLPRENGKYTLSVISAAPIQDPELVIYVVVDEPDVENQNNSYPAQVMTKLMWEKLFDYVGIYSDTEPGPGQYVPENDEEKNLTGSDASSQGIIEEVPETTAP